MAIKRGAVAGCAAALLALTGCGGSGGAATAAAQDPAGSDLTPAAAEAVLTAFDRADSAASSAGDLAVLRTQETSPALDVSIAAVHRATSDGRTQPAFQHQRPVFAIPAGQPSCFLVTATLHSAGAELTRTDVSQFVRGDGGGWKLSHNVQVATSATAAVAAAPAGGVASSTVDAGRREAVAAEVFARTTRAGQPDLSVLGASTLLDQQFAAGWQIYQQQMSAAGMAVSRRLTGSDWSACAERLPTGTVVFLTLRATDTIAPKGGTGQVTLPARSPDLVGTGHRGPLTGGQISVSRVQQVLLLVPDAGGPATLLGLNDAPTAATAGTR